MGQYGSGRRGPLFRFLQSKAPSPRGVSRPIHTPRLFVVVAVSLLLWCFLSVIVQDCCSLFPNNFPSFIETSIKQPICASPIPNGQPVIVKETTQLKSANLDLTIVSRGTEDDGDATPLRKTPSATSTTTRKPRTVSVHFAEPLPASGPPVCDFVNFVQASKRATLLLENPKGKVMPVFALGRQMAAVLGVDDVKKLTVGESVVDGAKVLSVTTTSAGTSAAANGLDKIIPTKRAKTEETYCRYVNVCYVGGPDKNGQFPCATLLLENPVDSRRITADVIKTEVAKIFGLFHTGGKKLEFHLDVKKTQELTGSHKIDDLHKRTIYVH